MTSVSRIHRAAGLGPGHRLSHCLNNLMWMGGLTDLLTLEAMGAPCPIAPGSQGELDLTHLVKECQPLVRLRTGDIVAFDETASLACGPGFRSRVLALTGATDRDRALAYETAATVAGFLDPETTRRIADFRGLTTQCLHVVDGEMWRRRVAREPAFVTRHATETARSDGPSAKAPFTAPMDAARRPQRPKDAIPGFTASSRSRAIRSISRPLVRV